MMTENKKYEFTLDRAKACFFQGGGPSDYVMGVLEEVDVKAFRSMWLKSGEGQDFLIDCQYNAIRYPKLVEFMLCSDVVWAPTIKLNGVNSNVSFIDGRHRFLWFALHGYERMKFAIAPYEVERFRELLQANSS
jgi:hypothetical protein